MTGTIDTAAERATLAMLEGHTPGPWVSRHRGTRKDIERRKDHYRITTDLEANDPDSVAIVHVCWRSNRAENARLIAVAPDLKDTLATALDEIDRLREALSEARAALNGETRNE